MTAIAWPDVPPHVRTRVEHLLRDFAACSAAGRITATARIAADYAATQHPGADVTSAFDGRRLSTTGAAFANGVLANALDFDDGHRLVKGHPGACVIPAALAVAEARRASADELRAAILTGYEVAIEAGMALHARSADYHASGAWGAIGAAAAGARLLGLDETRNRHALGLAEYHAPIAPTMRSVADPAMTKDACGWGAFVGVSSALLARGGFTALRGEFSSVDIGGRWHVLDVYVKKFPCCRWSHPAIEAALRVRADRKGIESVRVRTFAAAAALAARPPETTEEAQNSLVWPVAVALAHGAFGVEHVLEPAFADPVARELLARIEVDVDPELDVAFPGRRLAVVTVDGRESGLTEAPGEPDDPAWAEIVDAKVAAAGVIDGPLALLQREGSPSATS